MHQMIKDLTSASTISTKLVLTNLLLALSDVEISRLAGIRGRLALTLALVGIFSPVFSTAGVLIGLYLYYLK